MKTMLKYIGVLLIVVVACGIETSAQQSSNKVFWMVTVEVPLSKLSEYHSFNAKELEPLMAYYGYNPVVTWQTIVGDIEEVISVAEFENLDAYQKASVSLLESDEWASASRKLDSFAISIHTKLLSAASYSKLQ